MSRSDKLEWGAERVGAVLRTMLKTVCCALQAQDIIAGYTPGSNVVQHNKIDLDQKAIVTNVGAYNFSEAKTIYSSGHANGTDWAISNSCGYNSCSKGAARTLRGFSTNAKARMYDKSDKCVGCPYKTYLKFYEYYGDFDYADKWVMAALDNTTYTPANAATTHAPGFSSSEDAARKEAVQKGTAYMVVWMYAIREFEDAIDDCNSCTANCNEYSTSSGGAYNAVHAWDEGVAFYTGSLAGETADHNQQGEMPFALAEKRCTNYGTCSGAGGISYVNEELFKLFNQGRDTLIAGSCSAVRPILDDIIRLMTVPLVQGTLRYAYKAGQTGGVANKAGDQTAKNHAEGATFAQALLPLVHHCDAAAAKVVSDNMKFDGQTFAVGGGITGTTPDTAAVKAALESTYSCLGITCAHVGGLLKNDNDLAGGYYTGMGVCTEITHSPPPPPPPPSKLSTGKKIAVKVKAAGAVSDYDDKKKAELEFAMATVAGVSADAVTVTVTAGSVILDFEIITTDPEATKTTVTTALADTTKASAALGVTVEETPTVAVRLAPPPPTPPPHAPAAPLVIVR